MLKCAVAFMCENNPFVLGFDLKSPVALGRSLPGAFASASDEGNAFLKGDTWIELVCFLNERKEKSTMNLQLAERARNAELTRSYRHRGCIPHSHQIRARRRNSELPPSLHPDVAYYHEIPYSKVYFHGFYSGCYVVCKPNYGLLSTEIMV